MEAKLVGFGSSSRSCVFTSLSPPANPKKLFWACTRRPQVASYYGALKPRSSRVFPWHPGCSCLTLKRNSPTRKSAVFAISEPESDLNELASDASEQENQQQTAETFFTQTTFPYQLQGANGKPGFISFYNRPYESENKVPVPKMQKKYSSLLWFVGPSFLVASFILPSLYLRRLLSAIFEDSLLTDFLILFFTEALFYCGVMVFLLIINHLRRSEEPESSTNTGQNLSLELGQRISSVATLVLSLIVPMVTMGLVWPWTGPAAFATLAPYLAGIVIQFAFERYARYRKSPSWPVIPIIFQVYRLHQLNRAAQLVTALSFTVRGAEMTSHNLEISISLDALLNVLQFLGVVCIWSLSSFLMRFFPSSYATTRE